MELVSRFFKAPASSFFLFGPRGTGKSTFVRQSFPDALYVDLLDPERIRFFSAKPERLRELTDARSVPGHVIIDKIERMPELLPVVDCLIESKKRLMR